VAGFEELVREAALAPADGWDFGWLDGRAVEERPSWHYFDRVAERAAGCSSLLEVDAGVGRMAGSLPTTPRRAVATEGHPPSVARAARRLRARGVALVVTSPRRPGLPFAGGSLELVVSRHPIAPGWREVARVLTGGGSYLAQHVGPDSLRSLSEFLMGPLPKGDRRDPSTERRAAEDAGLVVRTLDVERPRTAFFDVGAVVYFLRVVPWIVPDFEVGRYRQRLRALHEVIERDGGFETTASRMLVEAVKPSPG
jgi:SAM-dependent methyltransferase